MRPIKPVQIVKLGRKTAIDAIQGARQVYLKCGVWNPYEAASIEKATGKIARSGYGADVFKDGDDYYVSIPSDSDMW